ncbi:MAG: 23S rRNA pseudouridine(2604) synthase RluF [Terrimonas sp.]|nr:23S rRNA pseudouridine(2604) synthase RluF [Terrimonas sp.]
MDNSLSLNKFISDTGYCSKREADQLIVAGRVLLNGQIAVLGNRYAPGDEVVVDGSLMTAAKKEKLIYIALNKPAGITTTAERHIKGNIIDFVNHPKRIFPVGRLDKDSEGLILLTNDGDIVNRVLRAGNQHEKEYIVRVNKPVTADFIKTMSEGLPILGTTTLPCKVQMMGRQTFRIVLIQGLNRQIRRMCEFLGYKVVSLQRIRIMHIKLDKLATGKWRYLSEMEIMTLKSSVEKSLPDQKRPLPAGQKFRAKKITGAAKEGKETQYKKEDKSKPKTGQPRSSSFKEFRKRGKRR